MKQKIFKIVVIITILAMTSLACGISGGTKEVPTATSAEITKVLPTKTQPPAEPTAESTPTKAVEKPTKVPATSTTTPTEKPELPSLDVKPGMYIYSNANMVKDLALYDGILYAVGAGGVVAWDLESGAYTKSTTQDGLKHINVENVTVCSLPDPRILISTYLGVNIYDPATKNWNADTNIPAEAKYETSHIGMSYCDAKNNRLIFEYYGIHIIDLKTGTVKSFTTKEGLLWDYAYDITVVGKDVWIAHAYKGVSVIKGDKVTTYEESNGLPDDTVYSIVTTKDGAVWMGANSGLIKYKGGKFTLYGTDKLKVGVGGFYEIELATDGSLWLGSAYGDICQFDTIKESCKYTYTDPKKRYIAALILDEKGNPIYAASTHDGGVYHFDGAEWRELRIKEDITASNFFDSGAVDSNGMMWIGTDIGIHRFDPAKANDTGAWETFTYDNEKNSPGGGWASGIYPQPDGTIWFAITNGYLSKYDGKEWTVCKEDPCYSVRTLAIDKTGQVWMGTSEGISVWDGKSITKNLTLDDGLPGVYINALLWDGDVLWIGTDKGLARYQGGKVEVLYSEEKEGLESPTIMMLAKMGDGLLIGTYSELALYDGKELTNFFRASTNPFSSSALGFAIDRSGRWWVGTYSGLLYSDDEGKNWAYLTTEDGLPTNSIEFLATDPFGTLWVGGGWNDGGGGLTRIVP